MNEELFLEQLKIQLKDLPADEIEGILADYEAYFTKARKNGLTDQEAIDNLGHPREIVKELLANRDTTQTHASKSRSTLIALALIFFNLTFVIGPVFGLMGGYVGLLLSTIVFIASPLLVILKVIISHGSYFEMFLSFVLSGVGLLIFPYLKLGGEIGIEMLRKYYQWNVDIVRGGR